MFCANCGKPIADDSRFCIHCGAKVATAEAPTEPEAKIPEVKPVSNPTGQGLEEKKTEAPAAETKPQKESDKAMFETIIGKHSEYYLPEFEKVENGKDTKFKWAAFLFGPMFCIYRKC